DAFFVGRLALQTRELLDTGSIEPLRRDRRSCGQTQRCCELRHDAPPLLWRSDQIVELDDRVGFGPDAELPRIRERGIVCVDDVLPVVEALVVVTERC